MAVHDRCLHGRDHRVRGTQGRTASEEKADRLRLTRRARRHQGAGEAGGALARVGARIQEDLHEAEVALGGRSRQGIGQATGPRPSRTKGAQQAGESLAGQG